MIAALVLASLLAAAAAPGAPIEVAVQQGSVVGRFARAPDPGRTGR
jgi:hypothetical protein